ncbi:hypothetical protein BDV93DRAFT_511356 [Ceratobasidium sp. AG-I]|nr:hypothetical protein BDV93DRAFT_511356 [Ceratobasidium sp. AG-I]
MPKLGQALHVLQTMELHNSNELERSKRGTLMASVAQSRTAYTRLHGIQESTRLSNPRLPVRIERILYRDNWHLAGLARLVAGDQCRNDGRVTDRNNRIEVFSLFKDSGVPAACCFEVLAPETGATEDGRALSSHPKVQFQIRAHSDIHTQPGFELTDARGLLGRGRGSGVSKRSLSTSATVSHGSVTQTPSTKLQDSSSADHRFKSRRSKSPDTDYHGEPLSEEEPEILPMAQWNIQDSPQVESSTGVQVQVVSPTGVRRKTTIQLESPPRSLSNSVGVEDPIRQVAGPATIRPPNDNPPRDMTSGKPGASRECSGVLKMAKVFQGMVCLFMNSRVVSKCSESLVSMSDQM